MLMTLSVSQFVIVDRLELNFTEGFTVLTGETGAGKSIILDALGLLMGDRAEGSQVRVGQDRADLSARFDLSGLDKLLNFLLEQAVDVEEGTLLIRRVIDKNGRSKAFINGSSATLAQLKALGEHLVDIHGQHAHQSLSKIETQRELLDAFAGVQPLVIRVAEAFKAWSQAHKSHALAVAQSSILVQERERLLWQTQDLEALQPRQGEWLELSSRHSRLSNSAELIIKTQSAVDTLADSDHDILSQLAQIKNSLIKLSSLDDGLNETIEMLAAAETEISEAVHNLRAYNEGLGEDDAELYEVESRLEALMSAARKYRIEPEVLPEKWATWSAELQNLESRIDVGQLLVAEQRALEHYQMAAAELSSARQSAAAQLSDKISREMQNLAMDGACFAILLHRNKEPTAFGAETVECQVAANAGTPLRPMAKVASGGELSRISLALQVAISDVAAVPTLIFDEVDVGIGGRVAEVVGRLLKQLGRRYQVLSITHLPQVAAYGDQHWLVSKSTQDGLTLSQIEPLLPKARLNEIARMLGGELITEVTRHHAAEMLSLAN
ncbi:MAG: DNA repair protein RecN [Neisseriaceae bacterium]|nr:DNA repair protein RecN [Neisseriaceae bacterium]